MKAKEKIINMFTYIILIILAIGMLFPFIWMLSTSLKPSAEIFKEPAKIIPSKFEFKNYMDAWQSKDASKGAVSFGRFYLNSIIVSVFATIITLFFSSLAGYVFAKYKFPGKDFLFFCFLGTLMIPFQVILIPDFIILSKLNWVNSYIGLILPPCAEAFGIFLIRQFLYSIPNELIEAARIDGCSEFGIYWKIILPLMKPALAVLVIFNFMWRWNDFIWPLIVVKDKEMFTLQLALAKFRGEYYVQWNYVMAMGIVSVIPLLIIFIFCQRYFVQGISFTGSKG